MADTVNKKWTKELLIKSIPALEQIFVVYSRCTQAPYVERNPQTEDDEVLMFLEEEAAKDKAKALSEDKRPVWVVKVEKADMLKMFTSLFFYGIDNMQIMAGTEVLVIGLEELVKKPDQSNIPPEKRMLENPQLQMSMMRYMQEARRPADSRDLNMIADMQEEMEVNLLRARYFIPFHEAVVDGKKATQLVMIINKEGTSMIPIFTDASEYGKFKGKQDFKTALLPFETLKTMELPKEAKGFLVNPGGAALLLQQNNMERLSQTYEV